MLPMTVAAAGARSPPDVEHCWSSIIRISGTIAMGFVYETRAET